MALECAVHRTRSLENQIIKTVRSSIQTAISILFTFLLFLSTTSGKMLSIPFNALSESSSMSFTYPPTTKLSKQSTPVDENKPIMQNQKKRSLLFNKRSSSPSLRLGHPCHHRGSLHSRKEVVAKMVKQKKSMDGGRHDERADWKDPKKLEAFCQLCVVQVMEGQRKATGFLSKIGINEVTSLMPLGGCNKTNMFLVKLHCEHCGSDIGLLKLWRNS